MQLLDGKRVSKEVLAKVKRAVQDLRLDHGVTPGLAVVIIGNDPASSIYVRAKVKRAAELGIDSRHYQLPESATQVDVLDLIAQLNADTGVHGILVQSPPPAGIDERAIVEAISPTKDVDCFNPYNVGKLTIGDEDGFLPCTPAGIVVLLRYYDIDLVGKHVVILGRSNIVGKPLAALLSRKSPSGNATVTLCHSRTTNLVSFTRQADVLVAAMGCPALIGADMIREGVILVDVGINRVEDRESARGYKLVGDIDTMAISEKAAFATPVPGGVGPMTIAMLMYNSLKACCQQHNLPVAAQLF